MATAVETTEAAVETADTVVSALDGLAAVSDVFGIAGVFLSFVEAFLPDEDQMILKELKQIEAQIEHLREDMVYFFSKVIDEEKQATCFQHLSPYENKIRSAWQKLQDLHAHKHASDFNTYVNIFKDECANAACSDAARGILNVISGRGSFLQCDMLSILYEGNPEQPSFFQGVRDQVVSKAGYLTTLVTLGVTAESAYQSIANNDKDAWKIVQSGFTSDFKAALKHVKSYDSKCKKSLYDNVAVNIDRILHENPHIDDKSFSKVAFKLAHTMRPEFLAQATVYGDLYGFQNHSLGCYQCKTILHKNKKYNINIAYLDPKKIMIEASRTNCWTGLMVVKNGHNYWTDGNLISEGYTQFHSSSHHNFVLQFWAQERMPCARFKSSSSYITDEEYFANLDNYVYEEWPSEEETTPAPLFLW